MSLLDLFIILGGFIFFIFIFIKYRGRTFKESFAIGIGTGAYILIITSIIELTVSPNDIVTNFCVTSSTKNAFFFLASVWLLFIATKDSLTPTKDDIVNLGIPEEVVNKLNGDGRERLLVYANDLIASGLYTSSPSEKGKKDCNTNPSADNNRPIKQYHITTSKSGTVDHFDISLEEITCDVPR